MGAMLVMINRQAKLHSLRAWLFTHLEPGPVQGLCRRPMHQPLVRLSLPGCLVLSAGAQKVKRGNLGITHQLIGPAAKGAKVNQDGIVVFGIPHRTLG